MRIWSLHPQYLDRQGLLAVWRESLLAKKVLQGKTKGYYHHPQLNRFRQANDSALAINLYLLGIYQESLNRGYSFDISKIAQTDSVLKIRVTAGQICYETTHLLKKLAKRDIKKMKLLKKVAGLGKIQPHPLFRIMEGSVAEWERV